MGNNAQGLAYDSGRGEVFVANAGDGTVSVISDASNSVVATIPVSGPYGPAGVAYDSGMGEVFVSDGGAGTVSVISDATNTVVASVPVGGNPGGIAYDAGRGEVFVADGGSTLSAISDATNTVVATVTVGSGTTSLAYDSGRGEIFSANTDGTVSVVSDTTNTVVATIAAVGYGAAVYDPATAEVFVANGWPGSITAPGTVSVISDATNTVVATVAVGNTAQGAAYDSRTGEVFVGNHYSSSVSVISDATDAVTATVGGVGGPTGVAYDAGRGEIFVGDSNFNSVTVIADGSPPVPVIGGIVHDMFWTADQPVQADTVASGTSLTATRNWSAGFGSQPPDFPTLPDPTVSIDSGFPSSEFSLCDTGQAAGTLPIVVSAPGSSGVHTGVCSTIPATIRTGCDLTRSVTPLEIPVGGVDQTLSFTVRCTDPAVNEVQSYLGVGPDGASLVSFEPPDLSQGEQLTGPTPLQKPGGYSLDVTGIVTGKPYTFTLVFAIPNPFGIPFLDKQYVGVNDYSPMPGGCPTGCGPQTSAVIADPTLDGPTLGAGQVTFSDTEPHVWYVGRDRDREYALSGTGSGSLSYAGPSSSVDGAQVTLTAFWSNGSALPGTPVTFELGSQSCTGTTGSVTNPDNGDTGASCTITLAQPVGAYTLDISSSGDVSVYPSTTSASFSITGPTTKDQCKDGGWKVFGIFKNQGDCVSYVATGGKNPPSGG